MNPNIKDYIKAQYFVWLKCAKWHCKRAKMGDEASDLLHEVLEKLITTNKVLLERLFNAQDEMGRELDRYVVKMIKLNVYSPSSPYLRARRLGLKERDVGVRLFRIKEKQNDYLSAHYEAIRQLMIDKKFDEESQRLVLWRLGGETLDSYPSDEPRHCVYRRFRCLYEQLEGQGEALLEAVEQEEELIECVRGECDYD